MCAGRRCATALEFGPAENDIVDENRDEVQRQQFRWFFGVVVCFVYLNV